MKTETCHIVIFCIALIFGSCHEKQNLVIEKFELIKNEEFFQTKLNLKNPINFNSSIDITIIDGNNDGFFYLENDKRKDANFPDRIVVKDLKSTQYSGAELADSIYVNLFKQQFLITIDLDNLIGSIIRSNVDNSKMDISLTNILPNDTLMSMNRDQKLTLTDLVDSRNKYVIIKNWAPYCEPCIKEISDIEENLENYDDNLVKIIYIIDSSFSEDAHFFFENKNLGKSVYLCDYDVLSEKLNFKGFPSSILFNGESKYIRHYSFQSTDRIINDLF